MKELQVKEFMRSPVITIAADAGLDRALTIMRTQRIRHLPVVDNDHVMVGLISDRDLRLSMEEQTQGPAHSPKGYFLPALTKVRAVMVSQVVFVSPETPLVRAARLMSEKKFGCLPVVDSKTKELAGIITETDMLRLLSKLLEQS